MAPRAVVRATRRRPLLLCLSFSFSVTPFSSLWSFACFACPGLYRFSSSPYSGVMPGCCALQCSGRPETGFAVFAIPQGKRDALRTKTWLHNIGRKGFVPTKNSVLCEVPCFCCFSCRAPLREAGKFDCIGFWCGQLHKAVFVLRLTVNMNVPRHFFACFTHKRFTLVYYDATLTTPKSNRLTKAVIIAAVRHYWRICSDADNSPLVTDSCITL